MELAFRGYSHWSMSVAGGLALTAIYAVRTGLPTLALPWQCLLCAAAITVIEFLIGCAVNRKNNDPVWDYSHLPFHYKGQICLGYFLLWLFLSLPALQIAETIARWLG